jgi:rhodanese-related sulfurtransferase
MICWTIHSSRSISAFGMIINHNNNNNNNYVPFGRCTTKTIHSLVFEKKKKIWISSGCLHHHHRPKPTIGMNSLRSSGSSSSSSTSLSAWKNVDWEEMDSILDDYEELGREGSGLLVMDVRNEDEVAFTGQLSPNTKTLPLPLILQANVFALEENEFEELCGFPKPSPEETLVFSCAAGIRSVSAARMAAQSGYTRLINYTGGANEWFTR